MRAQARDVLRELEERSRERYVSPYNIMLIHLGLGDREPALEWLGRALEDRSGLLWQTPVEPRFDAVRDDSRFKDLIEQHGLQI